MIELVGLTKKFNERQKIVLDAVSAKFERGNSYVIKGFSGAGKSTLIHLISGTEKPTAGKVLFEGKNIFELSEKEHSKLLLDDFGLIFQFPYLVPEFSVLENVATKGFVVGMDREKLESRAMELLESAGLADRAMEQPSALSGGEKQRVSLLRALFLRPKFLLGDELTAHLDTQTTLSILNLIDQFKSKYEMGVIICSHDPVLIARMSNVLEIYDGKLRLIEKEKRVS